MRRTGGGNLAHTGLGGVSGLEQPSTGCACATDSDEASAEPSQTRDLSR